MDREVLVATAVGIIIALMFTYTLYILISPEKRT